MAQKTSKKGYWQKIKGKAPKYPDITCPQIDDILARIEKAQTNQKLSEYQHKIIIRKLEQLRTDNEQLRESGRYWHESCKEVVEDMFMDAHERRWKKK